MAGQDRTETLWIRDGKGRPHPAVHALSMSVLWTIGVQREPVVSLTLVIRQRRVPVFIYEYRDRGMIK